jgi:hypothetical protein
VSQAEELVESMRLELDQLKAQTKAAREASSSGIDTKIGGDADSGIVSSSADWDGSDERGRLVAQASLLQSDLDAALARSVELEASVAEATEARDTLIAEKVAEKAARAKSREDMADMAAQASVVAAEDLDAATASREELEQQIKQAHRERDQAQEEVRIEHGREEERKKGTEGMEGTEGVAGIEKYRGTDRDTEGEGVEKRRAA